MTRRIALLVMVLSLMLPVVATADIIGWVSTYDYHAYYTPTGGWTETKDVYGYLPPHWETTGGRDVIAIDNIQVDTNVKYVWLEIDFVNQPNVLPTLDILGHLVPPGGNSVVVAYPPVERDAGTTWNVTWKWLLIPQPDEEKIYFPGLGWSAFTPVGFPEIAGMEVATYCVPLPATAWMGLSAMGCLMAFYGWRKARTT